MKRKIYEGTPLWFYIESDLPPCCNIAPGVCTENLRFCVTKNSQDKRTTGCDLVNAISQHTQNIVKEKKGKENNVLRDPQPWGHLLLRGRRKSAEKPLSLKFFVSCLVASCQDETSPFLFFVCVI